MRNTKQSLPRTVDAPTFWRIVEAADRRYPTNTRWYALFLLLYYTGLRIGEAVRLPADAVDRTQGLVCVPNVPGAKTGARVVPLPSSERLCAGLDAWEAVRAEGPYYFTTRTGGMVDPSGTRKRLRQMCERAGVDPIHPHILRHTYASDMIARGMPITYVQTLLGHSTLEATMVYAHARPQDVIDRVHALALE